MTFARAHICGLLLWFWLPLSALACTTVDMLDLIGSLEAPEGYNQVYGGVRLQPPRPITTMTVNEVMAWQRQASKTAVSSAAGRYQVIRATMQSMVDAGVVDGNDVYSPATQDRIGSYLLGQAGYQSGATSDAVLNRVSGVWAALPRVSGAGAGQSTYQGIAGNHALIDARSYQQFAACEIGLDNIERASNVIRAGLRFGVSFDDIIVELQKAATLAFEATATVALQLLLLLFALDLIWRGMKLTNGEDGFGDFVAETIYRIMVVSLCALVISNASAIAQAIGDWGARTGEGLTGRESYSLGSWARDKFTLILRHLEGARVLGSVATGLVYGISLVSVFAMALTMARVVYVYANLLFSSVIAMFSVSFAGLEALTGNAQRSLLTLVGIGLEIIALNLVLFLALDLTKEVTNEAYPVTAAGMMLMFDVIACVMAWTVPANVGRLATRGAAS